MGNQLFRPGYEEFHDLRAMARLGPHLSPLLPWSKFSMRPSAVELILNEILINKRKSILELGSGVSTLVLLSLAHSRLQRFVSVDDDAEWSAYVRDELARLAVPGGAYELVNARLTPITVGGETFRWYDQNVLREKVAKHKYDLLIVDAPKGTVCPLARHPALPLIHPWLEPGFSVVLDDIHRADEQAIVRRWKDQYGLDLDLHACRGGVAILRHQAAATLSRTL